MLISVSAVFSGCSLEEFFTGESAPEKAIPAEAPLSDEVSDAVPTNEEWLTMINDVFHITPDNEENPDQIQAAQDWGIIPDAAELDLNQPVDEEFVTSTLMKAAGFVSPDAGDEEIRQTAEKYGISGNNTAITSRSEAVSQLLTVKNAWNHQTFERDINIEYMDNVVNYWEDISPDDISFTDTGVIIPSEYTGALEKDSILIVPKNENGEGGAYKTISVQNNGDGTSTVISIPASIEEVYKRIDVSDSFDVDCTTVELLRDDVTVSYPDGTSGLSDTSVQNGGIVPLNCVPLAQGNNAGITFGITLGDNLEVAATVKNIRLNTDIDWSFGIFKGLHVDHVYMGVDYDTELSLAMKLEKSSDDSAGWLLARKYIDEPSVEIGKMAVYICPGISVNLRIKLSVDVSGSLQLLIDAENTKGFEIINGKYRPIDETTITSQNIIVAAEIGAYTTLILALSLDYIVGVADLISLELKVGPTLKGSVTIHENDSYCIDISGFLKIELKLYLLKDIGNIGGFITLADINEENSPWKVELLHIENGVVTDSCTWEEPETEESSETENIPTGIFELDTSYISIDVGKTVRIGIKSLPTGYTADDIVWNSSDPDNISVDANGNIFAASSSSALITASTSDGKYQFICAVNAIASADSRISVSENAMRMAA